MSTTEATCAQIAQLFGVSNNQVYTWSQRREHNGFPEPVGTYHGHDRRSSQAAVYDINEVIAWYVDYEPRKGGAPAGNRNAPARGQDGRFQARQEVSR